jgi:hypothetical protein
VSGGCVVVGVTVLLGIYLRGNNPATNRKKISPTLDKIGCWKNVPLEQERKKERKL